MIARTPVSWDLAREHQTLGPWAGPAHSLSSPQATIRSKHIMSVYGIGNEALAAMIGDFPTVHEYLHKIAKKRVERLKQLHINDALSGGSAAINCDDEEDMRTPLFESAACAKRAEEAAQNQNSVVAKIAARLSVRPQKVCESPG